MSASSKPIESPVRMRTFGDWLADLSQDERTSPTGDLAKSAYLSGQRSVFAALHELSYHTKSSEEFILRAGILYGEVIKGGGE